MVQGGSGGPDPYERCIQYKLPKVSGSRLIFGENFPFLKIPGPPPGMYEWVELHLRTEAVN